MRPRVFSIGPGCPFLETFVTALFKGQVIPEFSEQSDSFKLAKFRIYVPTRRAARALATEIRRQSCGSQTLLPEILPLGALDDDSPDVFDSLLDLSLPPAVSDLERRMILGELVLEW